MQLSKIEQIDSLFKELTYDEKAKVYSRNFASGYMSSGSLQDKLKLENLICLAVKKIQATDSTMNSKKFLSAITGFDLDDISKNTGSYKQFAFFCLGLSIVCDDLLYFVNDIDKMGYETSEDVINEILRLINQWMPF